MASSICGLARWTCNSLTKRRKRGGNVGSARTHHQPDGQPREQHVAARQEQADRGDKCPYRHHRQRFNEDACGGHRAVHACRCRPGRCAGSPPSPCPGCTCPDAQSSGRASFHAIAAVGPSPRACDAKTPNREPDRPDTAPRPHTTTRDSPVPSVNWCAANSFCACRTVFQIPHVTNARISTRNTSFSHRSHHRRGRSSSTSVLSWWGSFTWQYSRAGHRCSPDPTPGGPARRQTGNASAPSHVLCNPIRQATRCPGIKA